jgi:putative addiction module antidote
MLDLKVRKVGNSLGLVLPKEVLSRLKLNEGDKIFLIEAPDGSYSITPYDPEFEKQMQIAGKGMARFRNTLRALAK